MRGFRLLSAVLASGLAAVLAGAASAVADTWPSKPVRVLIGFAPGGPTDVIGRLMSEHLGKALGQPFVVEPRPGASGVVAGQILAAAPPDGHTLYVISSAIVATAKVLYADMTYDPATAFQPVTVLVRGPLILEVAATVPATTVAEFVAWAKANPGKLNHGSPGVGTQSHLIAELFRARLGFDSTHIPYRGVGAFAQGMMQREVHWAFDSANTALQLADGGHVRFLAVTTAARWPARPEVPTLAETGQADATLPSWFGLVVPAGTARMIVDRLHQEIVRAWALPENIARIRSLGFEPASPTPEETAAFIARERERWTAVIRANNIKPE
ncbi:MAG: tripartite tricarboxylate transporter substrate binding protein [Alphaproteobacteria bacterium]|nr:tripartite tricarboxylate transporter substrate binding protein [Alphaproteobacteria bacterium]